jgi:hypothetical protein
MECNVKRDRRIKSLSLHWKLDFLKERALFSGVTHILTYSVLTKLDIILS